MDKDAKQELLWLFEQCDIIALIEAGGTRNFEE